jgi:hypothetical protein
MPISGLNKPFKENTALSNTITVTEKVTTFINSVFDKRSSINKKPSDVPMIEVSSAVSGAAHLYERLRYSVDYHEEHVLRRHALARILKRRFESLSGTGGSARSLLVELIHAGYLKNNSVPEVFADNVQKALDRYEALFNAIKQSPCRDKAGLTDWFIGVAASELDDFLVPHPSEDSLIELAISYVSADISLNEWNLTPEEQRAQMMIAAYRALYVLDLPKLHYILLKLRQPDWSNMPLDGMVANLPIILRHHQFIETSLQHETGEKLFRLVKKRALVFHAINDLVLENGENIWLILSDKEKLEREVQFVCNRYYKGERQRLWRSAVRSTAYIFLTKVLIALLIEVPIERFIYGDDLSLTPLMVNILFPPVLMFLLTATTRFPGAKNTSDVSKYVVGIVKDDKQRVFPEVAPPGRSSAVSSGFLSLIYLLMFGVSFGVIAIGLSSLGFTPISIGFFVFFLCVVSFFAMRIRQPVRDLYVIQRRDNIFVALIQFFSLPILKVGRWISLTSSRFNVLLYLFDYFLEAPVKSFLLITEDVLGFFRQKREDIL